MPWYKTSWFKCSSLNINANAMFEIQAWNWLLVKFFKKKGFVNSFCLSIPAPDHMATVSVPYLQLYPAVPVSRSLWPHPGCAHSSALPHPPLMGVWALLSIPSVLSILGTWVWWDSCSPHLFALCTCFSSPSVKRAATLWAPPLAKDCGGLRRRWCTGVFIQL